MNSELPPSSRQELQRHRHTQIEQVFTRLQAQIPSRNERVEAAIFTDTLTAVLRYDHTGRREIELHPMQSQSSSELPHSRNYILSSDAGSTDWRVFEELVCSTQSPLETKIVTLTGVGESHLALLTDLKGASSPAVVFDPADWEGFKTLNNYDRSLTRALQMVMYIVAHRVQYGDSHMVLTDVLPAPQEDDLEVQLADEPSVHLAEQVVAHLIEFDMQHKTELVLTDDDTVIELRMHPSGIPEFIEVEPALEPGVTSDMQRTYTLTLIDGFYTLVEVLRPYNQPDKTQVIRSDILDMRTANDLMVLLDTCEPLLDE